MNATTMMIPTLIFSTRYANRPSKTPLKVKTRQLSCTAKPALVKPTQSLAANKNLAVANQLSFEWSCFEIYNEHVRDIMIGQTESSDYLKVIENGTGNFECMGLTNYAFSTYEDFEV
jgi:hypothetical protein